MRIIPFLRVATLSSVVAGLPIIVACNTLLIPVVPGFEPNYTAKSSSFVNWETPHVSPLALTSDGTRLLAVNTPDGVVELFDVAGTPTLLDSIPVGIDPVSVRLRGDDEAWVVNFISDSVSVIDLKSRNVIRTLQVLDEPTDVAFAGEKAFVVCAQHNTVQVFDLADLDASPREIAIAGEHPRAATVSPDGKSVYVAVFESGNHTTLVAFEQVSETDGPYGGVNPPPNVGTAYVPEINPSLPLPPPVSMIVRKDTATGAWLDDNGGDWRDKVYWDLHDHDLAIIDSDSLAVRYATNLMTANMQLAALPGGKVIVVGTESKNEQRFEPNITGRFVHAVAAIVDTASAEKQTTFDLNPHLADAYARKLPRVESALRAQSVADPRGIAATADGSRIFVSGMGSDNVVALDDTGRRLGQVDVGQGPTGLALDEARRRLFVLNRFDASISVVDAAALTETTRVAMHDATPAAIKQGRPFLYSARRFGGLGVTACASCHLDSRTDQLAWDLGDPRGDMKVFNQKCNRPVLGFPAGDCEDFHPMKGPMTTQTLQNIIGDEPFHWRGDRENLAAFNPAFVGLLGGDRELTDDEMAAYEAFLATIIFPPNPNRNLDNTLKPRVGDGDPRQGEKIYFNQPIDLSVAKCNDCHNATDRGAGTNRAITSRVLLVNHNQSIKVPQIRNQYQKKGFSRDRLDNELGFGNNHDGVIDGLFNFFHIQNFTGFGDGETGDQQRRDIIAYVMSFSSDTHAGVGAQLTLDGSHRTRGDVRERFDLLSKIAATGEVGLIAKGIVDGQRRGYAYVGSGMLRGDRIADPLVTLDDLWNSADRGSEVTITLVVKGTELRLGIDRDENGVLNGDE